MKLRRRNNLHVQSLVQAGALHLFCVRSEFVIREGSYNLLATSCTARSDCHAYDKCTLNRAESRHMNVLLDGKLDPEPGARNREGTRQFTPEPGTMIIAKAGQDDRCILGSASILALAHIPCMIAAPD